MIIIFSSHYPFEGEPFLQKEIDWITQREERVCVVPLCYHSGRYPKDIPRNLEVLLPRKKRFDILALLLATFKMVSPRTWKEKRFAYNVLGYKNQKFNVNKSIFLAYYISFVICKTLKNKTISKDTIVYSYWMTEGAFFLSEFKKKHPETVCICRTHGSDCFIDKFYQPFRREILSEIDAVFPISEAGKRSIETLLMPYVHLPKSRLMVQRLGVNKDSQEMNPDSNAKEICIVTCSNIIQLKRLDLMIDALALIHEIKIRWIHFGDGDLMETIQQEAHKKLDDSEYVSYAFFGGKSNAEIMNWYANHHVDAFVNCSDSEGIPVSIMEAFSYGIPAIARDVGGNSEIIETEKNGILLKTDCTESELKDAIIEMSCKSIDSIKLMRQCAYETYMNKYNALVNYKQFYETIFSMR